MLEKNIVITMVISANHYVNYYYYRNNYILIAQDYNILVHYCCYSH